MTSVTLNSDTTKPCLQCGEKFPYERSTAKFCSGACRKANHDAQQSKTPKELEGDALITVRARQQKKEIERALIEARKAVRATKKIERDRLKAENKRLGIEQALEIQTGNKEIPARYAEQAQSDFTNGILGIQIAAQDKQEGL
jgi:hypothetical protein